MTVQQPDPGGGASRAPAILEQLSPDDRNAVAAWTIQQLIEIAPSADFTAILNRLPAEQQAKAADDAFEEAALDRESRRAHLGQDIADRKSARLLALLTLVCGWGVAASSIIGASVGMTIAPDAWIGWVAVALAGVGGPTAVSILAGKSRVVIDLTSQNSDLAAAEKGNPAPGEAKAA